jgi:glycosyltransferase involved in cell wall biosynthesis
VNEEQIKILLLPWQVSPGNYTSASSIRIIDPFKTLSEQNRSFQIEIGDNYYHSNFDAVVIEKIYKENVEHDEIYTMVDRIKSDNALLIYHIDDNLYDLYASDLQNKRQLELLSIVCWLTRNADAVICSSDDLSGIIKSYYNPRTYVFSNYLSRKYLPDQIGKNSQSKNTEQIEIGYMGTLTHFEDLKIISNALKEIMFEYNEVTLHFVGIGDANKLRELMKPYPIEVHFPPSYKYEVFTPWFIKNFRWDIGLAPLENTAFNRSKSDIKLLDIASIGASGIYSKVVPYLHIENDGLGLVVDNDDESWYLGLKKLIEDQKLRESIQKKSINYLRENRVLENNIHKLRKIIDSICQS